MLLQDNSLRKQILIILVGVVVLLVCVLPGYTTPVTEPAITPGSADEALTYYIRISKELGFEAKPNLTTLDNLLDFAGYPISGAQLEALDSPILMDPGSASAPNVGLGLRLNGLNGATLRDGDILAARFFAPKIANVKASTPIPGWRKLIRLRVRPDSRAAQVGIESVIILFNFFAQAGQPPFSGHSLNTQVMLVAPALADRLYWMDFDPSGKLTLALSASFDAADLPDGPNHDYFVPDGCNACHGSPANFAPPMVNYLDTDHWFDRLDDDFKALKDAGTPILFDAQTNDSSKPSFTRAFDVIRRFNEEALQQNALVRPKSFEAEAARTWLKLHAKSDEHFPPTARGFSLNGGAPWQASEADGLGKLNRYCFRCHGSVHFSVFDRSSVLSNAGGLQQHIKPNKQQIKRPGFKMPPDRDLDPQEIQALYDFLGAMK